MSTPTSVKSTQIVAGVAIVTALLGGAYAVGRSHGDSVEPAVAATTPAPIVATTNAPVMPAPVPVPAPQPQRLAAAEVPPVQAEPIQERAAVCQNCGRVTDVHTESRRGHGSGVGAVGGAVVGGLLGNMVGGGNGRKLATVAGAVGGGYAGNEIEKNQKSTTVWIVQIEERDGRTRRFERSADPGLRVGDEVRLTQHGFTRA